MICIEIPTRALQLKPILDESENAQIAMRGVAIHTIIEVFLVGVLHCMH
jgi:hypothetical protein